MSLSYWTVANILKRNCFFVFSVDLECLNTTVALSQFRGNILRMLKVAQQRLSSFTGSFKCNWRMRLTNRPSCWIQWGDPSQPNVCQDSLYAGEAFEKAAAATQEYVLKSKYAGCNSMAKSASEPLLQWSHWLKQSRGNWELQRPSTTAALSSFQSGSQTLLSTFLNKTEADCSETDRCTKLSDFCVELNRDVSKKQRNMPSRVHFHFLFSGSTLLWKEREKKR